MIGSVLHVLIVIIIIIDHALVGESAISRPIPWEEIESNPLLFCSSDFIPPGFALARPTSLPSFRAMELYAHLLEHQKRNIYFLFKLPESFNTPRPLPLPAIHPVPPSIPSSIHPIDLDADTIFKGDSNHAQEPNKKVNEVDMDASLLSAPLLEDHEDPPMQVFHLIQNCIAVLIMSRIYFSQRQALPSEDYNALQSPMYVSLSFDLSFTESSPRALV